jgi:hypothetical protein
LKGEKDGGDRRWFSKSRRAEALSRRDTRREESWEAGHTESQLTKERYINFNMGFGDALKMWLQLEKSHPALKARSLEDFMVNPAHQGRNRLHKIPEGFSHPNLVVLDGSGKRGRSRSFRHAATVPAISCLPLVAFGTN